MGERRVASGQGTLNAKRRTPHAPRPNEVGGPTTFPWRQKVGGPSASGNLRLGHRAPGRGGRRASIPLKALPRLLSTLGTFCLFELRVFQTFLDKLHPQLFRPSIPSSARSIEGGPPRPTPLQAVVAGVIQLGLCRSWLRISASCNRVSAIASRPFKSRWRWASGTSKRY